MKHAPSMQTLFIEIRRSNEWDFKCTNTSVQWQFGASSFSRHRRFSFWLLTTISRLLCFCCMQSLARYVREPLVWYFCTAFALHIHCTLTLFLHSVTFGRARIVWMWATKSTKPFSLLLWMWMMKPYCRIITDTEFTSSICGELSAWFSSGITFDEHTHTQCTGLIEPTDRQTVRRTHRPLYNTVQHSHTARLFTYHPTNCAVLSHRPSSSSQPHSVRSVQHVGHRP